MDPSPYFQNTPLMKQEWFSSLQKTLYSRYAPKWNAIIGDRIQEEDLGFIQDFETKLYQGRELVGNFSLILSWLRSIRFFSPFFYERLKGIALPEGFECIPFMTREDLQEQITDILPEPQSLSRMIINPSSGTTGRPILAPNHPKSIGCYVPLIEYSLFRHGVSNPHDFLKTSAIQLCNQNKTIVYATCHSLAGGAKFAKINLKQSEWPNPDDWNLFIQEESPCFLSGDPYSFESAMRFGLRYKPKAIHSTASELTNNLYKKLKEHFDCPIINFYSSNETGPIAYSCPNDPSTMHLISPDIYLELIQDGEPSQRGEVTVSGGRNPFLPLLRYKTGDWGEWVKEPCLCGEKSPRIRLLEGRRPVFFTDTKGQLVNPIDISRILRQDPNILRHQFIETKEGTYEIHLSILGILSKEAESLLRKEFLHLLGQDAEIHIMPDLDRKESKSLVFINERND
ncbi:hypothetical protein LPTSP4_23370 [Leptospira ryugenii]|uniref:Uncharacterized protein n=1 Tax=Leptospira ryugenii TaxID=1917863 RepID=A0A2P2E1R5_9LEPT|nr:phenylacetate--CoA ligase [Leptospira ryugenii]GBF50810.1 hypothetical protein LPTSP4_23370 [Leptospira ryugenii]